MSLGENIHAARKISGLSQEALGEKLGVVSQTVSKWERGESAPDAALLPSLADALGVSLDALFDRTPSDKEMEKTFWPGSARRRKMSAVKACYASIVFGWN